MSGNHQTQPHSPEEILLLLNTKDDEAEQAAWKHLYKTAYDEYRRFFARSIWEWAGKPSGRSLDFWLAGQNVATAWYQALVKTPWWLSTSSDQVREMKEIVPIEPYLGFVNKLAREISDHADRQYMSAQKDFWVAAEQTALAIVNAAVAATRSADEIRTALMKEFEQFSPEIYLKYLREAAYFTWEERNVSERGDALGDLLTAERQAREKLRAGERIANIDAVRTHGPLGDDRR